MTLKMNLRKMLPIADLVPEAIDTLSFKIDNLNTAVTLLIYNKGRYEEITGKTTDSDGRFSVIVRSTEEIPSDLEAGESWFNRYAGPFYFQVSVAGEIIPVAINFEGVVFEFKNITGSDTDYLIDISTGDVTPPVGGGLDNAILDSTFILV